MRIYELANSKAASRPVVYVDMDGVLADFFGEVAKREGASHWRRARKIKDRIDQVAQEPGFFLDLKPLPNAPKLIRGILDIAGEYSILSSPMMSNVEQSVREKSQWLNHYLKQVQPTSVLFEHQKERFAQQPNETPNILIDDWDANIQLWEANGGIGILYTDDNWDRVLKQLKHALMTGRKPKPATEIREYEVTPTKTKLLTNNQVLDYIKDIHDEYHLEKPVLKHKTWMLHRVPIAMLQTPEFYDQDDPYRRVIDLDWDHINSVTPEDIENKPAVADHNGWVLDGNHRVIRARALGLESVMCITPYTGKK